jgi:hypothetical protein
MAQTTKTAAGIGFPHANLFVAEPDQEVARAHQAHVSVRARPVRHRRPMTAHASTLGKKFELKSCGACSSPTIRVGPTAMPAPWRLMQPQHDVTTYGLRLRLKRI